MAATGVFCPQQRMNKKNPRVNFDFFFKSVTLFRLESVCDN